MTDNVLNIRPAAECRWDCASFGEVMLRFDPGFGRVRNARSFQVWEVFVIREILVFKL